jgi:hypothetical protein
MILFSTQRLLGYTFGAYLCLLAVTSGIYHASLQETPQFLDVAGIYLVLFAAVFYAIERAVFNLRGTQIPQKWQGLFMLLPLVGIPMAAYRGPVCLFDSTTVFIVVAVLLFGLILRQMFVVQINLPVVILLLISASSFFFRLTDGYDGKDPKILCHADSAFQAHAMWHILSAVALLLVYDLFAWIGADVRILGESSPTRRGEASYPRIPMALWALSAGVFFLVDAVLKLQIVFQNHDDRSCVLTGIIVAALFLILSPLVFFKVIEA